MIDLLQPTGEFAIEFFQRADPLPRQTQAHFKILLQGPEHPLDFAAAPGPAHFGVDETDAQIGADDAQVMIDEGAAVVGIQLSGQAAAANGFFKAEQQGLSICGQGILGIGNQKSVPILLIKQAEKGSNTVTTLGSVKKSGSCAR